MAGALFWLVPPAFAQSGQGWMLLSRHGECAPIDALSRRVPEAGAVSNPHAFVRAMRDQGFAVSVNGMFAPAKTPPALLAKIHADVVKVLSQPETRKLFANDGLEPVGNRPHEFAAIVNEELIRWRKRAKLAGIKAR